MLKEENAFTPGLRSKAVGVRQEWGWRLSDIPQVVEECLKLRYAILGGQIQFRLPGATCELYWLRVNTKLKKFGESWKTYVKRSCQEFTESFNKTVKTTDFIKEASDWPCIKERMESGVNIMDYLCFVLYPRSKQNYRKDRLSLTLSLIEPKNIIRSAKVWLWKHSNKIDPNNS